MELPETAQHLIELGLVNNSQQLIVCKVPVSGESKRIQNKSPDDPFGTSVSKISTIVFHLDEPLPNDPLTGCDTCKRTSLNQINALVKPSGTRGSGVSHSLSEQGCFANYIIANYRAWMDYPIHYSPC